MIDDIWHDICTNYLNHGDLFSIIRLLNKSYHKQYSSHNNWLIQRVPRLIQEAGLDFDKFKELLIKCKGVVTGSCLLNLVHPDIKYNDIDIIVPHLGYRQYTDLEEFLYEESKHSVIKSLEYRDHYDTCIKYVKTYNCKVKIQVILSRNLMETLNNFDFSIARNYWNGKELVYTDAINVFRKQLVVNNNNNCRSERKWTCEARRVYRITKYFNKGFTLTTDVERSDKFVFYDVVNFAAERYHWNCLEDSLTHMNDEMLQFYNTVKTKEDEMNDEFEDNLKDNYSYCLKFISDTMNKRQRLS